MESERIVKDALRRQAIFKELSNYLGLIKETVKEKVDRGLLEQLTGGLDVPRREKT